METHCDGRQDGAQCYGALGGTVVLQLMDNASEIPGYYLLKERNKILHGRNNIIIFNNIENRSVFTPSNGTFMINNLSRTDGGEYGLILLHSGGFQTRTQTLHLFIQGNNFYGVVGN